jgi:c-di-AMP phosphodiesterase-like protein
MKTTEKQFDAVKYMRQQREKLSDKLSKMSKTEIVEYFRNRKLVSQVKPCG